MILVISFINPGIAKNLVYFLLITFYNFPTFFTSKPFAHIRILTEYYKTDIVS